MGTWKLENEQVDAALAEPLKRLPLVCTEATTLYGGGWGRVQRMLRSGV